MQLTGFEGQAAFVAGAGGGIGRAIVAALADSGAQVFASDLEAALEDAPKMAGVTWAALDVTDPVAVAAAVAQAQALYGPLRHGIFAAGILGGADMLGTSAQDWQRVVNVNLNGGFFVTTELARAMVVQGRGAIVAVGSNSADIPRLAMGAYPASKAALHMHMRCLGLEVAPKGIRCNIVAPGSTLTPMQTGMWADASGARAVIAGNLAIHKTGIPLGKLATPQDIAQSVMFLLSDQAGHITMADLYVDGGATLKA
ncbi:2,3-dihydro-2,3-dihydroxybenzoate dehydrogenase [Aquimixticola soesokkakensis]|uniref:2,3-dihydro-2,3-dihydroxybenzoate dehydrogenase n=1 Tax=Aquimixticola soesokkakensis TaxID=1519096 RepID=A0A1Y5T679_9RHOB|nr:SDR family oxidoreductase [Aquimixticola soesokkakensis]SLN56701.1 2,3-dihydro-2,3-dihydroxybenzoate dehydrogenase [Aquimixticola soesokkakensis]